MESIILIDTDYIRLSFEDHSLETDLIALHSVFETLSFSLVIKNTMIRSYIPNMFTDLNKINRGKQEDYVKKKKKEA